MEAFVKVVFGAMVILGGVVLCVSGFHCPDPIGRIALWGFGLGFIGLGGGVLAA